MTKEELEKYARDNRKRLEEQEVKLGDVVEVLVGRFAGEKGVIVGIIACGNDYADPYYEIDMACEVPDKYKCRKTLITPNNVIGGLSAYEFKVVGNRAPKRLTDEIKAGDRINTPKGMGTVKYAFGGCLYVMLDNGEWWVNMNAMLPKEDSPTDEIKVGDIVRIKSNAPRKYCLGHAYAYKCLPLEVRRIDSSEHVFANSVDGLMHFDIPACYLEPYYSAEDVRRMEEEQNKRAAEFLREHSDENADDPIKSISDAVEEYRKGFAKITSELVDFDWQHYRAELASKIAVAYAERAELFEPRGIGELAVTVANDVVDNLKKHEV